MMNIASTLDAEGKIYFTNLISYIHKYSDQDFSDFLFSLKNNTHDEYIKLIDNEFHLYRIIDFKSLIVHEQTHFLDLTSTSWGLEFNHRKNKFIREAYSNNEEPKKTFSLNYSEILKIHRPFDSKKNINSIFDYTNVQEFRHFYFDSRDIGVLLDVQLSYKNNSISIPVSMLSVLESHAFSNEYISKYSDVSKIKNIKLRNKIKKQIDESYKTFMNNPNYHEYNILLKLIDIHYTKFKLNNEQILKLCSAIMGFCLDVQGVMMSDISNQMYKTINNRLRFSVKADWMRGLSRHILAFKIILLMYDYAESIKANEKRTKFKNLLKLNPLQAIYKFIQVASSSFELLIKFSDKEKEIIVGFIQKIPFAKSNIIFDNFIQNNNNYVNSQYVLNKFNDFKLLNMFRDDDNFIDNIIEFPVSFDIDIEKYYDDPQVEKLSEIDKILTIDKLKKIHMDHTEAERMVIANSFSENFKYIPASP